MVLFLTIIMITLRRRGFLSLVFNGLIYSVVFSLVLMIIDNVTGTLIFISVWNGWFAMACTPLIHMEKLWKAPNNN